MWNKYTHLCAMLVISLITMVKTCSWGTCNSDTRYPERVQNVRFILFPKPTTNQAKFLRWVKSCGRPHWQFNQSKINRHTFVCSKHFVAPNGPAPDFPDPLPADGSNMKKTRLHWKSMNKVEYKPRYQDTVHPYIKIKVSPTQTALWIAPVNVNKP